MATVRGSSTLSSMKYKSFTWKHNPATCAYSCDRSYVSHKYPGINGAELEDMGTGAITITGDGEFFGSDAYSNWVKLNKEFEKAKPGVVSHPVFTNVTRGLLTKLQAKMEPRENYVSFSFEIVSDTVMNDINKPLKSSGGSSNDGGGSNSQIKVGDVVILTGYAYYDSYGRTPRSAYKNGVKYTVTYVNYKGSHPIHCGSLGWCRLQDVKLANGNSNNTGGDIVYTVKSGDTLSEICAKYGANWKKVAEYNKLKNPHLIFPNQKIKIPRSMITK